MRSRLYARFIRDLLTDENDDFDIIGVSMFLVTLTFIFMGVYDLVASHREYQLLLVCANALPPAFPRFDLQGWGVGAAALLGGHGINSLSRRAKAATTTQTGEEHE